MLQEMKHRIKNSIAKMLAIARQTAANSNSLQDFTSSFVARMQAMAASQDMLTRSQWQKADLGKLLRTELEQVFVPNLGKVHLSGPQIELNETVTQGLGLTFHELATNALKYGEAGNGGGTLDVEWEVRRTGKQRSLALTWSERGQAGFSPPSKTGFGTKLIDMTITRELGGTIMRDFHEDGLQNRYRDPACGLIPRAAPTGRAGRNPKDFGPPNFARISSDRCRCCRSGRDSGSSQAGRPTCR